MSYYERYNELQLELKNEKIHERLKNLEKEFEDVISFNGSERNY